LFFEHGAYSCMLVKYTARIKKIFVVSMVAKIHTHIHTHIHTYIHPYIHT